MFSARNWLETWNNEAFPLSQNDNVWQKTPCTRQGRSGPKWLSLYRDKGRPLLHRKRLDAALFCVTRPCVPGLRDSQDLEPQTKHTNSFRKTFSGFVVLGPDALKDELNKKKHTEICNNCQAALPSIHWCRLSRKKTSKKLLPAYKGEKLFFPQFWWLQGREYSQKKQQQMSISTRGCSATIIQKLANKDNTKDYFLFLTAHNRTVYPETSMH